MIPVLFLLQASKLDLCLESVICRIRRCKGQFSSGAVFGSRGQIRDAVSNSGIPLGSVQKHKGKEIWGTLYFIV